MIYILIVIYLLPTILALCTKYKDRLLDVIVVNVLLGWTGIMWAATLIVVWEEWDWWNGRDQRH